MKITQRPRINSGKEKHLTKDQTPWPLGDPEERRLTVTLSGHDHNYDIAFSTDDLIKLVASAVEKLVPDDASRAVALGAAASLQAVLAAPSNRNNRPR